MGTTIMFTALAQHEDYFADKVSLFIALAPSTSLRNCQSKTVKWSAEHYNSLVNWSNWLGINKITMATSIALNHHRLSRLIPALSGEESFDEK